MLTKDAKDFWIWLLLFILTIGILIFAQLNWYSYYTDKTGITTVIIFLFLFALGINFINTINIFSEFAKLKKSKGLFKEHIDNLQRAANKRKLSISQDFSLTAIENRLLRQESWVQLFANLLVTLGMIGTVLGLTLSMKGLSKAIDNINIATSESNSGNIANSMVGLGEALSGMSSAFITTLAGAFLGGLFLKLLSHSTTNLIEDLIDSIRTKAETEKIPELQNKIYKQGVNDLSYAYENMRIIIDSSQEIKFSLQDCTSSLSTASHNINNLAQRMNIEILNLQKDSQIANQKRLEDLLLRLAKVIKIWNNSFNFLMSLMLFLFLVVVAYYFMSKQ